MALSSYNFNPTDYESYDGYSRIYKFSLPKHKVTVLESINGEGSVSQDKYYFGDKVEISSNANLGYELQKVTVIGETFNEEVSKSNGKYIFKMPIEDVSVTLEFDVIRYKFTEGMNQVYNNKDMIFKLNDPRALLSEIYIDGELLNSDDYTLEGTDNTVVVLSKKYLNKLDFSNHKIKATYTNGSVDETTFNLNVENPSTYDEGIDNALILGSLGLLGICLFVYKLKNAK